MAHADRGEARTAAATLQISVSGDGRVTSADTSIDCGQDCRARYRRAREIELTAVTGPDHRFVSWTGGCHGTTPSCIVALMRTTRVRAVFERLPAVVSVAVSGPGTVVSVPPGLQCGSTAATCSADFGQGTPVKLFAGADAGATFDAWDGPACAGRGTLCELVAGRADLSGTMAVFRSAAPAPGSVPVSVKASGGRLTSTPAGIECPPDCSASFPSGTEVRITAPGFSVRWESGCVGVSSECGLIADRPIEVSGFVLAAGPPPPPVTRYGVNVTVSGRGRVSGGRSFASTDINCGAPTSSIFDCKPTFPPQTVIKLKATANRGSRFYHWGSFCEGTRRRCTFRLRSPKDVIAVFRRR